MNKKLVIILSLGVMLPVFCLAALPAANAVVDFGAVLQSILDIAWKIFFAVAVIMFLVAGFLFLTAQGDPTKVSKAKMAVLWGLVGVAVGILGYSAVSVVTNIITPVAGPSAAQCTGNTNCDNGAWQSGGYASSSACYEAYGVSGCSEQAPAQGACCLTNPTACNEGTHSLCTAQGGTYRGDDTTCSGVNECN